MSIAKQNKGSALQIIFCFRFTLNFYGLVKILLLGIPCIHPAAKFKQINNIYAQAFMAYDHILYAH